MPVLLLMSTPQLLPHPRHLRLTGKALRLPSQIHLEHDGSIPERELCQFASRLTAATNTARICLKRKHGRPKGKIPITFGPVAPASTTSAEEYNLTISRHGIHIGYRDLAGLRAAGATLCQLLRQFDRRLPCLAIRDWPDFPRRGVLLDVSRGRIPKLETLKQLTIDLAGFKINELQLYFEHTFAYRNHPEVWRECGALTAFELRKLDAHCRELGIDLVPNQNSFGHLRHWLRHKRFKRLAEVHEPYESEDGTFLRYPSTLAPNHRGTLPFLRGLYDEFLPNFSSPFFNVGCDETWDLGRGQSRALCDRRGRGRVYLDFLLRIHREVQRREKTMMFWGDIILKYPELIQLLPKDVVALNWGYEADHSFAYETQQFANAKIPFYVCPGTSTWQTMIGRNDNAFANLESAARSGKRHSALGYLITDWGDGGHPQPLAVSYPAFAVGAAMAWCHTSYRPAQLASALSREVFHDPTGKAAQAVLRLGVAHRRFHYQEPNVTPFGAVLASPPAEQRELFCRNGLKYYARFSRANIRNARSTVARERVRLKEARPTTTVGRILIHELDLAAQMAEESCRYLLWQQAVAAGQLAVARALASAGTKALNQIKRDLGNYWPTRNKGMGSKYAAFLDWRVRDYRDTLLHYSPEETRIENRSY